VSKQLFEVFVVSDGTGDTGAAAVRAVMLQFQSPWRLRVFGGIRLSSEIDRVIAQAVEARALVIFSLVDGQVVGALCEKAEANGVQIIDLLGPLLSRVAENLHSEPRHQPGLLHGFSRESFIRADAVEFAVRHDDGANLHTLFNADIVLVGVSRTSKTPLGIYLAQRGYKAGNVPLVPSMETPRALLDLDPRKIFALELAPDVLLTVRQARLHSLGVAPSTSYANPEEIALEVTRARRIFRANGWRVIDVSGRAVEETASRIIELYQEDPPGSGGSDRG
jgi:regulator of PEP synthase PpsR (kinase-PPPase family)